MAGPRGLTQESAGDHEEVEQLRPRLPEQLWAPAVTGGEAGRDRSYCTRLGCLAALAVEVSKPKLPGNPVGGRRSGVLQPDGIVDSMAKLLLAPEVTLCRLDRSVAQKELNLLQFATRQMEESGTCAPQILRSEVLDST